MGPMGCMCICTSYYVIIFVPATVSLSKLDIADAAVNRVLFSAHLSNRNDVQSTDIGATLQTPTRAFSSFGQSSSPGLQT